MGSSSPSCHSSHYSTQAKRIRRTVKQTIWRSRRRERCQERRCSEKASINERVKDSKVEEEEVPVADIFAWIIEEKGNREEGNFERSEDNGYASEVGDRAVVSSTYPGKVSTGIAIVIGIIVRHLKEPERPTVQTPVENLT